MKPVVVTPHHFLLGGVKALPKQDTPYYITMRH